MNLRQSKIWCITNRAAVDIIVPLAVVNAVKGDLAEGENGELCEAMGYVRKSERKFGLHREAKAVAAATK